MFHSFAFADLCKGCYFETSDVTHWLHWLHVTHWLPSRTVARQKPPSCSGGGSDWPWLVYCSLFLCYLGRDSDDHKGNPNKEQLDPISLRRRRLDLASVAIARQANSETPFHQSLCFLHLAPAGRFQMAFLERFSAAVARRGVKPALGPLEILDTLGWQQCGGVVGSNRDYSCCLEPKSRDR